MRIALLLVDLGDSREADFDKRTRAGLAAVAVRDPDAIADLIAEDRTPGRPWDGELRGLLLLGGRGDIAFAGDNPWGIPGDADLIEALRLVWAAVADRCPHYVATITRETLGLALVHEANRYLLGYMHLDRLGSPDPPPRDLGELSSRTEGGWIAWTWGSPPVQHDAVTPVGVLDHPVPPPIRDLARIHSSLVGQEGAVSFNALDQSLGDLFRKHYGGGEEHWDVERIRAGAYDRYVYVAEWPPGAESDFLDLDHRDSSGDPCVVTYNGQDHRIHDGVPIWEWFDRCAPAYLFGNEDYL